MGEIFSKLADESLESYRLRIPILSPASGILVTKSSFEELLRQAIRDTLYGQIRWDKIPPAYADMILQDEFCQECVIMPCASNSATHLLSTLSCLKGQSVSIDNTLSTSANHAQPSTPNGRFGDSKIAVVGFSGRFPDAASNDEFWRLLRSGKDTHRTIPKDRFDWEAHFDPSGAKKNTSRVKYGCFVNEPASKPPYVLPNGC